MDLLKGKKRIHFVGIGGIGMSAIAQLLAKRGFDISGSDIKDSDIIGILKNNGIRVYLKHSFLNIQDSELVVYSSAISPDNPELIAASEKGIPVIKRAVILAELMNEKIGIAVSGAHGKTTTSSMAALLLKESSLNPTVAVGGVVKNFSNNALLGDGNLFVIEADESDGSFLYYRPFYSVITNIDKEHLDYYRNMDEIISAYAKFADNTKKDGKLICFGQDENIRKILKCINRKYLVYGLDKSMDIYADDIKLEKLSSSFNCFFKNKPLGRFFLNIPGIHNVLNSLAVIGIGIELNLDSNLIKSALSKFDGTERRFQIKLELEGITVIDDYAHHPSEIQATMKVFDNWPKERLITVFQPHRFTRTKYLAEEFGRSFAGSDLVIITEIYAAGEKTISGVSADLIIKALKKNGHSNCLFVPKEELISVLLDIVKTGDILLMLGAGDIGRLSTEFSGIFRKIKYHSDKL